MPNESVSVPLPFVDFPEIDPLRMEVNVSELERPGLVSVIIKEKLVFAKPKDEFGFLDNLITSISYSVKQIECYDPDRAGP